MRVWDQWQNVMIPHVLYLFGSRELTSTLRVDAEDLGF